jgi:uncharacterized protein YneR
MVLERMIGMKLEVSKEAAQWYINEMNLQNGQKLRFFVRYGGCSTVQSGFSLGVEIAEPFDIGVQTNIEDILFFIEEKDLWYFDQHDLVISLNEKLNEPVFEYTNHLS